MCLAAGTGAKQSSELRLDRKLFLDLLDQTCRRTGWQIHAYCLMGNHFHPVVKEDPSNSHHVVIRLYDAPGNVIETHEHAGEFKEW